MVHLIAYDLHQPDRYYTAIETFIQSATGGCFHAQESVWFVDTTNDQRWWRTQLQARGHDRDQYFVARLSREWASAAMAQAGQWLNDRQRRW